MKKVMLILLLPVVLFLEARHFAGDNRVYANLSLAVRSTVEEVHDRTLGTARSNAKNMEDTLNDIVYSLADTWNMEWQRWNQAVLDASITAAVKMELVDDELVPAGQVHVQTSNGVVTLTGTLAQQAQAERAKALPWKAKGVTGVVSRIDVQGVAATFEGGIES